MVMLSLTAEYALRAVVYLAEHPERAWTAGEIADDTQMPRRYLSKVMRALGGAGLVTSQRGIRGGYLLARCPEGLSLLEVVRAVGYDPRAVSTRNGDKPPDPCVALVQRQMSLVTSEMNQTLEKTTVAAMLPSCSCAGSCQVTQPQAVGVEQCG